jgi:pimeloyl-ACP methyl ester carboxylesterase
MTSCVRSSDGTEIAFDRYGDGPPVILVGGAIQHRAIDPGTARMAQRLGGRFAVYHYDRRGRGDSTDTAPWSVEREVDDLAALIDHAGGPARAFGMSSGGALVLEAAARGLPIEKIALYEPPFDAGGTTGDDLPALLAELVAEGRDGDALALFLSRAGVPDEALAQMRGMPIWPALAGAAPTLVYDTTMMADATLLSQRVPAVAAPLLVVDGGASPAWAREAAEAVAAAAPGARRRTLDGQTHEVDTNVLAPVLEEWFG